MDELTDDGSDDGNATGSLFVSLPVVAVFAFLTTVWSLQHVVDIYANPVIRWLFVVPYLVTVLLFDNGVAERLVYAVEPFLPVPGAVLWEAGNLLTYYLFALAVGAVVRLVGRVRRNGENRGVSTRAR